MTSDEATAVLAATLHEIAPEVDLGAVSPGLPFQEVADVDSMDFLNLVTANHDRFGISAGRFAGEEHLRRTEELLRQVGKVLGIPDTQQEAATALSGSGPACVYYLVEAMVDAGILLGIPRGAALEMVIQTVCGPRSRL
jgi:hypothetical protein